ncbi:MAG: chondroitinase-B domain-containing protein [Verrucomicrobiales bacterium]
MKFLVLPLALIATVDAKTIEISPLDKIWFEVLSGPSLAPGDEIVLASGTYSDPRRLQITQRGTATKPITIRAATGANVIFKRPDARQNSLNLAGCQYLILKDLEITGGDAAIRIGKKATTSPNSSLWKTSTSITSAAWPSPRTIQGKSTRRSHSAATTSTTPEAMAKPSI